MPIPLFVHSCLAGNILQLHVGVPPQLLHRAAAVPGQTPLASLHLTLARLDDLGVPLVKPVESAPPGFSLSLEDAVYLVDSGAKRSCFAKVSQEGQGLLRVYTQHCLERLGLSAHVDLSRVFHVTLSNGGAGEVRASVGAVWDFPAVPV